MIIAVKEEDRVVVGYSNADVWSGVMKKQDYTDKENIAIGFSDSGMMFAFAEMSQKSDVLLYDEQFMQQEITPKKIVKEVIPYMKQTFKDRKYKLDNGDSWGNALIICDNEHIYDIGPCWNFYEAEDCVCHGYKVEEMKSVMDETVGLPAEERIQKAFEFYTSMYKESCYPYVITDTKERKLKVVDEEGIREEWKRLRDLCGKIVRRARRYKRAREVSAPDILMKNEKKMLQDAIDELVEYYEGDKV